MKSVASSRRCSRSGARCSHGLCHLRVSLRLSVVVARLLRPGAEAPVLAAPRCCALAGGGPCLLRRAEARLGGEPSRAAGSWTPTSHLHVISLRRAAERPPTRPALPPGGVSVPGDRHEAPRPVAFPRGVGVVTLIRSLFGPLVLRCPKTARVRSVVPEGRFLAPALAAKPGQSTDRAAGAAFPVRAARRSEWRCPGVRRHIQPRRGCAERSCVPTALQPVLATRGVARFPARRRVPRLAPCQLAEAGWRLGASSGLTARGRQHLRLPGITSPKRRSAHLSSCLG